MFDTQTCLYLPHWFDTAYYDTCTLFDTETTNKNKLTSHIGSEKFVSQGLLQPIHGEGRIHIPEVLDRNPDTLCGASFNAILDKNKDIINIHFKRKLN